MKPAYYYSEPVTTVTKLERFLSRKLFFLVAIFEYFCEISISLEL